MSPDSPSLSHPNETTTNKRLHSLLSPCTPCSPPFKRRNVSKPISWVWNHFTKNENSLSVTCTLCNEVIQRKSNSTSQMSNHLERKHKTIDPNSSKTPSILNYTRKLISDEEMLNICLNFIVLDSQPLNATERPGFRSLIDHLVSPKQSIPSRGKISRGIENRSTQRKQWASTFFNNRNSILAMSATADAWTSRQMLHFLNVTLYYIIQEDDKISRQHQDLGLIQVMGKHTGQNLNAHFTNILSTWGLRPQDLDVAVTDSGANMLLAMSLSSVTNLRCLCHQLHLAVLEALNPGVNLGDFVHNSEYDLRELLWEVPEALIMDEDEDDAYHLEEEELEPQYEQITNRAISNINALIEKTRKLVRKVRKSPNLTETFITEQKGLNLKPRKLMLDVKTRWNSTLRMIERVVENHTALEKTLLGENRWYLLTVEELRELHSIMDVLGSMEYTLLWLQREKEAAGDTYMLISSTLYALNTCESVFGQHVRHVLERRWESSMNRDYYAKCHWLDPRKPKTKIKDQDRPAIDALRREFEEAGGEMTNQRVRRKEIPLQLRNSANVHEIFQRQVQGENFGRIDDRCEWERYRTMPQVTLDSNTGETALHWWAKHQSEFPTLFGLAMRYLNAPTSSAASERAFSIAGNIASTRRNRMKATTLSNLYFLRVTEDVSRGGNVLQRKVE